MVNQSMYGKSPISLPGIAVSLHRDYFDVMPVLSIRNTPIKGQFKHLIYTGTMQVH